MTQGMLAKNAPAPASFQREPAASRGFERTERVSFPREQRRSMHWPSRLVVTASLVLTVATVVLTKLSDLENGNGVPTTDAGVFATIGRAIAHGAVPYRDVWDHKPPGIFYLNALIFGWLSPAPWDIHLLEIPVLLLTAAAFFWLVRGLSRAPAAALATLLFSFFMTVPALTEGGNLTETYFMLPVILAVGLALRYGSNIAAEPRPAGVELRRRSNLMARFYRSNWSLALAGAACAAAMLLKPQAVLDLGLVEAVLLHRVAGEGARRRDLRTALPRILLPAATAVAIMLAAYGVLFSQGAGPAMWSELVVYNLHYSQAIGFPAAIHLLLACAPGVLLWSLALLAGIIVARCIAARNQVVRGLGATAGRRGSSWPLIVVVLWSLIGVIETSSDRHFWPHDFLLSMPSSVALCAIGIDHSFHLLERVRRPSWRAVPPGDACSALLLILAFSLAIMVDLGLNMVHLGAVSRLELRHGADSSMAAWSLADAPREPGVFGLVSIGGWTLAMQASGRVSDDERVASEIVARTHETDRVFLWTRPLGSYFLSRRRPASPFLYDMPLINLYGNNPGAPYVTDAMKQNLLGDLRRHQPQLIVVAAQDSQRMRGIPALVVYIRRWYRPVFHLRSIVAPGGYTFYRLDASSSH